MVTVLGGLSSIFAQARTMLRVSDLAENDWWQRFN
jgi:hypothetical protein